MPEPCCWPAVPIGYQLGCNGPALFIVGRDVIAFHPRTRLAAVDAGTITELVAPPARDSDADWALLA